MDFVWPVIHLETVAVDTLPIAATSLYGVAVDVHQASMASRIVLFILIFMRFFFIGHSYMHITL